MNKKFLHLSKSDLGAKFKFIPRIPSNAIMDEEGDIPRICVSTNLYDCVRGILGMTLPSTNDFGCEMRRFPQRQTLWEQVGEPTFHPCALYGTNRQAYLPPNHGDFRENNEHWFLTPVTMNRLGFLDLHAFFKDGELRIIDEYVSLSAAQVAEYDNLYGELCIQDTDGKSVKDAPEKTFDIKDIQVVKSWTFPSSKSVASDVVFEEIMSIVA